MVDFQIRGERIYYRERLFLPPDIDELKTQVIYRVHSTAPAGHPGRLKTLANASQYYWWPRMSKDIEQYVKACELCDRVKASRSAPPGFLQPLPIPFRAWSDISVDYITPLPACEREGRKYRHISVVVCRLTKTRHFIPAVGLDAEELANAFVSRIYCLHGTPDNVVSDRGTQFVCILAAPIRTTGNHPETLFIIPPRDRWPDREGQLYAWAIPAVLYVFCPR